MPSRNQLVLSDQFRVTGRGQATHARAVPVAAIGGHLLRYGLVGILLYFGAFKFTAAEAQAIQPLVANSPLLGWLYSVLSVQAVSNLIGCSEVIIAVLVATRPWTPGLSAWGSLGAAAVFLTTLSFLATTPGAWQSVPGFPVPVPTAVGGFLLKDVFLFGAAVWAAGEAWQAARELRPQGSCERECVSHIDAGGSS